MDNWIEVSGEVLHGPAYFPSLTPTGTSVAQMFSSSPTGGSESMALMYLFAITAATRSIDLSASYFVPDKLTVKAMLDALKRGVKLRIIVPGEHMDSETVRSASRATWEPLLAAGAIIAEYQPTMYHCKMMIVDEWLVSVGSTNFDNRSFRLNDEATLNILDAAFAKEQTQAFNVDLQHARRVTLADWRARPNWEKLQDFAVSLIGAQL
jgi:cardiolipin synthase